MRSAVLGLKKPQTTEAVVRAASSMSAVNRLRGEEGELWQPRFPSAGLRVCFDRALCTVKEYNEKVEYIHLNPVKAGLVSRPEDW